MQVIICPKCKKTTLEIRYVMNFDNLEKSFYPVCTSCGYTTKENYGNEETLVEDMKLLASM